MVMTIFIFFWQTLQKLLVSSLALFWLGIRVLNGFWKAFPSEKFSKFKLVVIYELPSVWDSVTNYVWIEKMLTAARLRCHSCFNWSRIMLWVGGNCNSLLTLHLVLSKLCKWFASDDVMIQASFSILKVSVLFSCSGKVVSLLFFCLVSLVFVSSPNNSFYWFFSSFLLKEHLNSSWKGIAGKSDPSRLVLGCIASGGCFVIVCEELPYLLIWRTWSSWICCCETMNVYWSICIGI